MELDPIVHEYDLPVTPERAFDVYVGRIGEWWHPDYTADPATYEAVRIEPGVGGAVVTSHRGGMAYEWGRVTAWERGRRVAHTSTLAQAADAPSEVSVTFTPTGDGCRVRFEHGGWNEDNARYRAKFGDWSLILDRYRALVEGGAEPSPADAAAEGPTHSG